MPVVSPLQNRDQADCLVCTSGCSHLTSHSPGNPGFHQQSTATAWLRHTSLPAEGKPIPTELKREAKDLKRKIELEDDNTAVPRTHIDDEYARAGEREPKVGKVRSACNSGARPPALCRICTALQRSLKGLTQYEAHIRQSELKFVWSSAPGVACTKSCEDVSCSFVTSALLAADMTATHGHMGLAQTPWQPSCLQP